MARILVVDDDPATAEFARVVLSDAGYQVTVANDGEAALERLATLRPDLILLDMSMPKMTGPQFLENYRRSFGPPIIAVSAEKRFEYLFSVGELDVDD